MVTMRNLTYILYATCFIVLSLHLDAASSLIADADVSAQMDYYNLYENRPLKGNVTVTHDTQSTVDTSSFTMDDKPLEVTFVKSVKMNSQSPIELSIYQFELPPKPAGLYVLSSVSVKVGGQAYTSVATSYEVSSAIQASPNQSNGAQAPQEQTNSKVTLNLQANVKGPSPLYPGQRTSFIYRFYFQGSIELVAEDLPLFTAKGFQKIGEEQVKEFQQDQMSITEVTQEVQALEPGEFTFPASYIEGNAFKEGAGTKTRIPIGSKLRAETPEINVTVVPFPAEGKPASFNGAVGQFTFQISLQTPSKCMWMIKLK